jgi:hypothetical protein
MDTTKCQTPITIIELPEFKDGDSIGQFAEKVRLYEVAVKRERYNIILGFLNEWLVPYKINLKSLLEFRGISESTIDKHTEHNKKTIKTNTVDIKKRLNIAESDLEFDDVDTDDIPESEILRFISVIVDKVGYHLYKYYYKESTYYSIKTNRE